VRKGGLLADNCSTCAVFVMVDIVVVDAVGS
jgi:hypothetical protein